MEFKLSEVHHGPVCKSERLATTQLPSDGNQDTPTLGAEHRPTRGGMTYKKSGQGLPWWHCG